MLILPNDPFVNKTISDKPAREEFLLLRVREQAAVLLGWQRRRAAVGPDYKEDIPIAGEGILPDKLSSIDIGLLFLT